MAKALEILKQMDVMHVSINEVALSGAVTACEKSSAWIEAMAMLQAIRLKLDQFMVELTHTVLNKKMKRTEHALP